VLFEKGALLESVNSKTNLNKSKTNMIPVSWISETKSLPFLETWNNAKPKFRGGRSVVTPWSEKSLEREVKKRHFRNVLRQLQTQCLSTFVGRTTGRRLANEILQKMGQAIALLATVNKKMCQQAAMTVRQPIANALKMSFRFLT
jgi:hypothetical protein